MRQRLHLGAAALVLAATPSLASTSAGVAVPAGWPAPHYRFENNPATPAGIELGRRLFYEPKLSRDGSVSCASCHQQASAFAHTRHRVSHGIDGQLGTRNAPALFNLAWQPDFMWDGAVTHLELQPLAPLTNAVEMGSNLPQVLDTLRRDADYPARFAEAFGSPGIDSQRLLRALTQFIGTMVSADSAYDRAARGGAPLSPDAEHGLSVFRQRCVSCHAEPLFSDYQFRNNGLDAEPRDPGRGAISGDPKDRGRFRVPSLRNVALTSPYMHDGRFETLREVIEHYAHGIRHSATLDPLLATPRDLSPADQRALLAFLPTLTDEAFVRDARYAEPRIERAVATRASWTARLGGLLERLLPGEAEARARVASAYAVPASVALAPARFARLAPPLELVGVRDAAGLRLYVDDHLTNAPRANLEVRLLQGTRVVRAAPKAAGVYRFDVDAGPAAPAVLVIRGDALDLRLDVELPAAVAAAPHPR